VYEEALVRLIEVVRDPDSIFNSNPSIHLASDCQRHRDRDVAR
jgi:hypothetical protein